MLGGNNYVTRNASVTAREKAGARGDVLALEAVLWALASTSSFEEGVLAAVNLGDDDDGGPLRAAGRRAVPV